MLTLPGPVVTADWLQAHHPHPDLRVVDARWSLTGPPGAERYAAGHLPGAIFLDVDHDLSSPGEGPGRHPLPGPEKLARVLGEAGIGDEHTVVAYDDSGGSTAARLWWLYRHFGRDGRCAILDGGVAAWIAAGGELDTQPAGYPPATWTPGSTRDDVVDAAAVAMVVARGDAVLIDARAPERYRGEVEPVDPRPGHLPGAISVPWSDNLDAGGRLRPMHELHQRYAAAGAGERPVIAYCGSGVTAALDLLALELAGIGGGRLYAGSWSDWCSDARRPAATGPTP